MSNITASDSIVYCKFSLSGDMWGSTDEGNTWHDINSPTYDINDILASGTTLLAGTSSHGLFRSTDEGNSWNITDTGFGSASITAIAKTGGTLLIGTSNSGVFFSFLDGSGWTNRPMGLNNYPINSFSLDDKILLALLDRCLAPPPLRFRNQCRSD